MNGFTLKQCGGKLLVHGGQEAEEEGNSERDEGSQGLYIVPL